jgi:hypothetical protein
VKRPQRLSDQYRGKALAELHRGGGWWPLQAHPCELEPIWEPFNRSEVTVWDCAVNHWEGPWRGSWLKRILLLEARVYRQGDPLILPEVSWGTWDKLVPIVVEQFPEDRTTIPRAEQFLLSLPDLRRPLGFEVSGVGPKSRADHEKTAALLKAAGKTVKAVTGSTEPFTVAQFVAHRSDARMIQQQLLAHNPNSAVTVGKELTSTDLEPGLAINNGDGFGATLALEVPYCVSLRTFTYLDPDPLGVVLAAMEHLGRGEWAVLQVLFQPARHPWAETLKEALEDPYKPSEYLFDDISEKMVQKKFSSPLFAVSVRILAKTRSVYRQLAGWAEQFAAPPQRLVQNESEWSDRTMPPHEREPFSWSVAARCTHRPGIILNVQELAGLVHLPGSTVASERLRRVKSRTRPAVPTPQEPGSILLGENVHQGKRRLARIPAKLRSRHCYLAGASGTGKSTLLLNLIVQDIAAGHGVAVIDPHADLLNAVLRRIPEERIKDVILFDPADEEHPFALNILESRDESERERITVELVTALERFFPASWGPRLERLLTFAIKTVLDAIPGATLADVEKILTDEAFRRDVISKTHDARFRSFWETQFKLLPPSAVDPVVNKLSPFLLSRSVRNVICQRHSAIDFDRLLNDGKILLANLAVTEKVAGMFGSFLVTKLVNAAFRRSRIPEDLRRPFYLYVDEFQAMMNVSTGFDRILAEARKYRLILSMANQYVGQLSIPVRQAIFGNVGTFVVFRLGVDDAHLVAKETGVFTAPELQNLQVGEAVVRAGGSATAFNLTTYREPPAPPDDPTRRIIALTRQRYARPRAEVERELQPVAQAAERPQAAADRTDEPSDPHEDDLVS